MKVFANRASSLLYLFLSVNRYIKPFLLPANICPVVPLSFLKAGVDFEFVDIDESHAINKSVCLDKLSTNKYQGLLFVHAYGKVFDNVDFYRDIKSLDPKLCIIDDKCLCIPDTESITPENVDVQLYSTGYSKYVELGFGGYSNLSDQYRDKYFVDSKEKFDKDIELRLQSYIKECLMKGDRYKLSSNLPWLDISGLSMSGDEYLCLINKKKAEIKSNKDIINSIYRENLPAKIRMGEKFENWSFCIMVNNQKRLLEEIFKHNLFAGTNFPSVSYLFKGVHVTNAELESTKIINLFNDFRINADQALRLCEVVNKYYE